MTPYFKMFLQWLTALAGLVLIAMLVVGCATEGPTQWDWKAYCIDHGGIERAIRDFCKTRTARFSSSPIYGHLPVPVKNHKRCRHFRGQFGISLEVARNACRRIWTEESEARRIEREAGKREQNAEGPR